MLASEQSKKQEEEFDSYLTVREFANLVRVDPQTVYKWIRQGDLAAEQIKRMRRIRTSEAHRFIAEERYKS